MPESGWALDTETLYWVKEEIERGVASVSVDWNRNRTWELRLVVGSHVCWLIYLSSGCAPAIQLSWAASHDRAVFELANPQFPDNLLSAIRDLGDQP